MIRKKVGVWADERKRTLLRQRRKNEFQKFKKSGIRIARASHEVGRRHPLDEVIARHLSQERQLTDTLVNTNEHKTLSPLPKPANI